MNSFELWLAWRHLKAKKNHKYLSLISYISLSGVTVGVAALVVVLSIMNGFGSELQKSIVSSRAHIEVEAIKNEGVANLSEELMKTDPRITSVTPMAHGDVMFVCDERVSGGIIRGISFDEARRSLNFKEQIIFEASERKTNLPVIYLGADLGGMLFARMGDVVSVVSPLETVGPFGTIPKTKKFEVAGFTRTGIYEYDAATAYVDIRSAQRFLGLDKNVSKFLVMISDVNDANDVASVINSKWSESLSAKSWGELNQVLLSALKLEKIGMFIILLMSVIIASFNILSTLYIMVTEKQREISIMKAMGAMDKQIQRIFWFEGVMIGGAGTLLGLILAAIACWGIATMHLPMPDVYAISYLPVVTKPVYFLLVGASSLIISFTATIFPSRRAAAVIPLQGIQYSK